MRIMEEDAGEKGGQVALTEIEERVSRLGVDLTPRVRELLAKRTLSTTEMAELRSAQTGQRVSRQSIYEAAVDGRIRSRRVARAGGTYERRSRPLDVVRWMETAKAPPERS